MVTPTSPFRNKFFLVAGDSNGAGRRKKSGDDQQRDSTIESTNPTRPLHHCGDQVAFQEYGATYVDSSSNRIQTMSGRFAATARSTSIAMFSAFDPLTKAATTRFGSTFHTPTLGWSTITVLATLSAASKTSGRAKRQSIRPYVTIHYAPEKRRQVRCVWVVSGAAGSREDGADARDVLDAGSRT